MRPGGGGRLSDLRRDRRQGTAAFPCRKTGTSAATISRRSGRLYSPPPSNSLTDFSLGLALRIAVSVRDTGATPPDANGKCSPLSDEKLRKKPAVTRNSGYCWNC